MKFLNTFCVLLCSVPFFLSCREELVTGIDPSKVPPSEVTYDQTNSSSTALGFYWEVDEAVAAGAVSFTAQIVKSPELGGNAYTGKDSQTFQASSKLNDGAVFNGLHENSKYYARVRANYPMSQYSEWVYVARADGSPAVIKLGSGIVDEGIETITGASSRLVSVSPSTAVVEWSVTDFTSSEVDFSSSSTISLYTDEACSDLFVSWDLPDATLYRGDRMRFIFSGLEAGRDYWFICEVRLTDPDGEELNLESEPLNIRTEDAKAVKMPSYVSEGQILLYQDFSELIWGGDAVSGAVGYSAQNRSTVPELKVARGWNPVGDSEYGFYLCDPGTEMGLYNSIGKALKGSGTSLSDWAELREDNSVVGMICARPGQVKIGASQKIGWIVTPELSALGGPATVEVSFKASPFGSSIEKLDPLESCIRLLDGVTVKSNIVTEAVSNNIVQSFDLVNDLSMRDYCFKVYNVAPSSRIAIGPRRSAGESGQHRMVIDDICIKVVSYGETEIQVETPSVSLAAGEGLVLASWQACENASSYDVQYRRQSDSDWTAAGNTTFTTFTVKGLYPETVYEIRVRAKYSETRTSEWSTPVSVRTPSISSVVSIGAAFISESQLGFRWHTDADLGSDITVPYTVELFADAECRDLMVRLCLGEYGIPDENLMTLTSAVKSNPDARPKLWNSVNGPCFVFNNLKPSTSYTVRVTNRNLQISSILSATTEPDNLVTLPGASATDGSVLIFENFGELLWGGLPCMSSFGFGMPGVNSEKRSTLSSFLYISGEDPLASDASRLWLCAPGKDYGLLNTAYRAVAGTRLKDWAALSEAYSGGAAGSLCGVAGAIKLGAANTWVQIVTPPLNCLAGSSTVEVAFDMGPYTTDGRNAMDPLDAVVKILEDVKVGIREDMHQAVLSCSEVQKKTFVLSSDVQKLTRYSFIFEGVKPGSSVAIGTYRPEGAKSGQRRAFLDNVSVKLVKTESK